MTVTLSGPPAVIRSFLGMGGAVEGVGATMAVNGVEVPIAGEFRPGSVVEVEAARDFKAAGLFGRRPILERFKARIVDGLVERGVPRDQAVSAVAEVGDRPILDWLFQGGGLIQIIEAILKLIGMFG